MRLFKYVVVSNANSIGLFPSLISAGLFDGFLSSEVVPSFGEDPVLFRRSHAKFLARELRRAGYHVTSRPYVLYMLMRLFKVFAMNLKQRRSSKAVWRK